MRPHLESAAPIGRPRWLYTSPARSTTLRRTAAAWWVADWETLYHQQPVADSETLYHRETLYQTQSSSSSVWLTWNQQPVAVNS